MDRLAVYLIRFAGAVTAVWGVAYTINAATRTGGYVTVGVTLRGADPALAEGMLIRRHEVLLEAWGATTGEQLLSRGDVLLAALCAGAAALLLPAVLGSVVAGRPFGRGDARRLGGLAVAVAVAAAVGPYLTWLAAAAVLARTGIGGGFAPSSGLSGGALVVAALLLVLALAARAGAKRAEAAGAASADQSSAVRPSRS
ncbi:hypothetical protein [Nonomuraea sp. SBT364]|uniref:hypothetical protein n=1 Tax=Nonomuraea sp. SBT364 TaxID=1580530 RepID=UPI00066A599E|nr:hypothetical protein [Nonomuraea sp. SBT364]